MSKLSTTKGKVFERRIAAELRELWPKATIHRSSQADRAYASDVVIEGDAPELAKRLWLELNDARNPIPIEKLEQAERDFKPKGLDDYRWMSALPVVVWHRIRERRIQATMRLATLDICRGEHDVETGPRVVVTLDWQDFLRLLPRAVAREAA